MRKKKDEDEDEDEEKRRKKEEGTRKVEGGRSSVKQRSNKLVDVKERGTDPHLTCR